MKTIKYFYLLSLILCICGNIKVSAQEFELTISCPETIDTNQKFRVSFKVSANVKEFEIKPKTPLSIKGGEVLYGPSQDISTNTQVLNGKVVESRIITQKYVVLSNDSSQDIIIDPMEFDVMQGDDVMAHLSTDTKAIKVITPKRIHSIKDILPNDVIFKWTTDKTEISLGDTILCNCDLYTLLRPTQLSNINKFVDDCIILGDTIGEMAFKSVEYEGKQYNHVRVQSFKIVPLRTGKFTIGGDTFGLELSSDIDPLDAFFNNVSPTYIHYEAKSNQTGFKVMGKESHKEKTLTNGKNCFLLCDISNSMTVDDIKPSRKICVQDFADKWMKIIPETGIISFAGDVEQYCAPNQKMGSFCFVDEPKVDGTAIGNAMIAPISCGEKVKDLIVITDGANNRGYLSLNTAFDVISKYNVRVSYIYLNSGNDSVDYISKGIDEPIRVENDKVPESELSSIKKMVESTGGIFGKARNKSELLNYLPKLKTLVDSEKSETRNSHKFDDKILGRFLNQYKDEVLQNSVKKE